MEIEIAIEAYRLLKKGNAVKRLTELEYIDEWNLLAGHLVALLGDNSEVAKVVSCFTVFRDIRIGALLE